MLRTKIHSKRKLKRKFCYSFTCFLLRIKFLKKFVTRIIREERFTVVYHEFCIFCINVNTWTLVKRYIAEKIIIIYRKHIVFSEMAKSQVEQWRNDRSWTSHGFVDFSWFMTCVRKVSIKLSEYWELHCEVHRFRLVLRCETLDFMFRGITQMQLLRALRDR